MPPGSVQEPHLGDGVVTERTLAVDVVRSTNYVPGGTVGTDSEYAVSGFKGRRNAGLAEGAPALLVGIIRRTVHEPERWRKAAAGTQPLAEPLRMLFSRCGDTPGLLSFQGENHG